MSTSQVPLHKRDLVDPEKPPLVAPGDLQFVLAALVTGIMRMVPAAYRPQFVSRFSDRLGRAWYVTNMGDVKRVRHHLTVLFGEQLSTDEIEEVIRRQLSLTAWNYLILNLIPSITQAQAERLLPVEGTEHLDEAAAREQPVLLLGAHVGPYAYPVAAVLLAKGYRVREIGHAQPRHGSSRLYRSLYWPRVSKTVEHLQVVNTLEGMSTAVLDILRSGQILYLLPDQFYMVQPGTREAAQLVSVDFLGHHVNLETGGLRLAKRLGARVLVALPRYEDGLYHVRISPLELPTIGLHSADLTQDLTVFMSALESCIRAQPFLWRDLRRSDLLTRLGIDRVVATDEAAIAKT